MKKSKQTIEESVNKIKFMINYDSSKTLTEQGIMGGNIPADTPADTPANVPAANNAPPQTANPESDRPTYRAKGPIDMLLNYYETYRDKISKIPRGVGDDVINSHAKALYDNMQGLTMNHKMIPAVFEDMKSPSDVIALIDAFNSTYGKKQDLKTWINHEMISNTVQLRAGTALKNIMINYQQSKKNRISTGNPTNPTVSNGYKEVTGTADDPYRLNTSGEGVKTVQGLLGILQDGKFGTKTQAALQPLGIQTFTNEDIPNLQAKIQGGTTPQEAPQLRDIAQVKPQAAPISQIKPKVGTAPKLASNLMRGQQKTT